MRTEAASDIRPTLILGGGGFLGTNLTDRFLGAGHGVINVSRTHLVRRENRAVRYLPPDPQQLADLVAQSACVVHMAHGSSPSTALMAMEENLATSMHLNFAVIRACASHGVPLIYLSSGGAIYGPDVVVPTPETAPTFPISPYGVEKLIAERYLEIGARHLGLRYRVLRISNPYGPWQLGHHGQGVIGTWMRKIISGEGIEIWGDGSVLRDYVYVDDVTDAMLRAIAYDGPARTFNIGSGRGQSLNEILDFLRPLCGTELRVQFREAAPSHVPSSVLDANLAARELNWKPTTDLGQGLARTWEWMCNHLRN